MKTTTEIGRADINAMMITIGMVMDEMHSKNPAKSYNIGDMVDNAMARTAQAETASKCQKRANKQAWLALISVLVADATKGTKIRNLLTRCLCFEDGSATLKIVDPLTGRGEERRFKNTEG
jgi:hypothetical protein